MKQIYCPSNSIRRRFGWFPVLLGALLLCLLWAGAKTGEAGENLYKIVGPEQGQGGPQEVALSLQELESMGVVETSSAYFDRAMHYQNSRFWALPLAKMVDRYDPEGKSDALLLNCFDDYQGIVSVADIRRYGLALATRIELGANSKPPDWLRPLLILVPDGSAAPFQERFLTANIRELQFVRLEDYYAPLRRLAGASSQAREGFKIFTDNCLYCHSLKNRGGNKGGDLTQSFDFSQTADRKKFSSAFLSFHHKDNADKQNLEQFVSSQGLQKIMTFLVGLGQRGK